MVTQMAAALVATGQAAQPYGSSPGVLPRYRTADDDARLLRYRLYLNHDAGKHDVGRLPPGLNPVVANYARVFVRKGASYLFPDPVQVSITPPDDSPEAATVAAALSAALDLVRRDNDLDAADLCTAIDAAVLGDGCYKVTWVPGPGGVALTGSVRIVGVDPQQIFVTTARDDVRRPVVVRHVQQMTHTDIENAYGLAYYDIAEGGKVEVAEVWSADSYCLEVQGTEIHRQRNPYGFIPYLVFPNTPRPHEFWGLSDIADIIDVNRALDRRLSLLSSLLEVSGNPVTVLENVTGATGINVAPGAVWELPEDAKAYLIELLGNSTVTQHLQFIEGLYRVMDDLAEMPRLTWGQTGGGARSGVALAIELQPIVQKTQRKRLIWSGMVEKRARYALRLLVLFDRLSLGAYHLEDFGLRAVWAPVLPSDRQALVADEIALYQSGLHAQKTAISAVGIQDADAEVSAIASDVPPPIVAALAMGGPDQSGSAPSVTAGEAK